MMMKKKGIIKQIGWFFASFSPLVFYMGIQAFITLLLMLFVGIDDADIMLAQIFSQAYGVICFYIWYYYANGRKRPVSPGKALSGKACFYIMCLGFFLEILINYALSIVELLAPDIMKEYEDLMELAGLTEISLPVILAAVVLAPIVEELVFRGCTMLMAQKMECRFWIVNLIQAAIFGLAHMNWIQSSYAFVLGLLLGYCCHKYHSLWASILLHFVFNFFGSVAVGILSGIAFFDTPLGSSILFFFSLVVTITSLVMIMKDEPKL